MTTLDYSHLRLLAVFVTVVETNSFAAASRQLGSSRSRVSEQVSLLEEKLGVRLMQRTTRQLLITSEGEAVYRNAKVLPGILHDVESAVTVSEPRGRVTITMNHDYAHKLLLPLLDEFRQCYPLVSLDLVLDDEPRDLIAEQIDLGIRIGLPRDSSLVGRVLHEESLYIFASPDYLASAGAVNTIKDTEKLHWILLPQFSPDNIVRVVGKTKTVEIRPSSFYSCNSPLMMQEMVTAGLGIGVLLPSMISDAVSRGRLVRVLPSEKTQPVVFSLVYPSRRRVPQRTRVLVEFLLKHASVTGSLG